MKKPYLDDESFVPLRIAAGRLGVPAAWLREEVEAGRLPGFKAGRRLFCNVVLVETALIERAQANTCEGGDA